MKKFKFRLQRVLEYREALKKEKERELMNKNYELQQAEQRLQQILEAQEEVPPADGDLTMAELSLAGDYLWYLQQALVQQRGLVQEAAEAVESAREAYIEKALEAKSLETLKEKRRSEHREEQRRSERKEMDKVSVQRHRFKRGGLKQDENG